MGGGLFGRIAIEKGLVTEVALTRALRFQEELRAVGIEKLLGDLLVDEGAMTADQVAHVCRLQHLNEQVVWSRRFAKIAVKNGLATQDQVDAAFEAARETSFQTGIGAVLVERNILAPVAVRAIRAAIDRADRANAPVTGTTPPFGTPSPTARLGVALEVEPSDDLTDLAVEKRIHDVLFAAVALRDGLVLVPELERALREQMRAHPDEPALEVVLRSRGVLAYGDLETVGNALEQARGEKLTIPGYTVLAPLGYGATSIVLRARHDLIGREVAIKLFRTEHVAATDLAALVEEAKTIAKIRHPNVVGLYDVGRVHRRLYYVMELVDGRTLFERIRDKGALPEREALEIAMGVAQALEAVHEAGLVHRDVKPLNILIARDGTVKLTDLGLAREVGGPETEAEGAVFGSPHTISPEQVQGESVDIRADLYGLGATLYQAVTGKPPYEGTDAVAIMTRHVTDPVPDPRRVGPEVSEATNRLIVWLMAKKREDRPASPTKVVERIRALLS